MDSLSNQIKEFEEQLETPRVLALSRIRLLEDGQRGFASLFLPLMRDSFHAWFDSLVSSLKKSGTPLSTTLETLIIFRVLRICSSIATFDSTLSEELGREGSHALLSRLLKYDASRFETEEDQDTVVELQDLAGETAAYSDSFPLRISPFQLEDLRNRLPLSFPVLPTHKESTNPEEDGGLLVLINQVTARQSAQKDVGFVMWPSAVALSRWIVTNPDEVYNKRILELGAGCGLVGLIAARLQVQNGESTVEKPSVILTDFNEVVLKNADRNIRLNGVEGIAEAVGLDFYQQTGDRNQWIDMRGTLREQVDLVLAADIICQPEDAFAAAKAINDSLRFGGKAIIICADSKHRFGVERFEEGCLELGLQIRTENVKDICEGKLFSNCMDKTTGYIDGMSLAMFTVEKPTQRL